MRSKQLYVLRFSLLICAKDNEACIQAGTETCKRSCDDCKNRTKGRKRRRREGAVKVGQDRFLSTFRKNFVSHPWVFKNLGLSLKQKQEAKYQFNIIVNRNLLCFCP